MARLRGIFLVTFWVTLIAILAPFMIAARLITGNENAIYSPTRLFVKLGLKLVGVRVAVTGQDRLDPGQTYIFTPNHQSMIEVPLLLTYLGRNPGYLAKKELFKFPIFGFGIRLMGVVPVDRSNSPAAVESARSATEKLRSGKDFVVYPEGTRSPTGRLQAFKKGAFLMAIDAGVSIVPVSISGGSAIMPKGQIKVFPSTIRLTIHEPISKSLHTREKLAELMELTHQKIASGLTAEEKGDRS
jgi:1-acyl-sn-glycerol-3-phosphate acyltransferase